MYLKTKIYDDPNADPDIVPPKRYRANTIKCWKKAWPFSMVNKMTNLDKERSVAIPPAVPISTASSAR